MIVGAADVCIKPGIAIKMIWVWCGVHNDNEAFGIEHWIIIARIVLKNVRCVFGVIFGVQSAAAPSKLINNNAFAHIPNKCWF